MGAAAALLNLLRGESQCRGVNGIAHGATAGGEKGAMHDLWIHRARSSRRQARRLAGRSRRHLRRRHHLSAVARRRSTPLVKLLEGALKTDLHAPGFPLALTEAE